MTRMKNSQRVLGAMANGTSRVKKKGMMGLKETLKCPVSDTSILLKLTLSMVWHEKNAFWRDIGEGH